ncbi:MAG: glycoside hydrolase family 127 protein [Victivallales bacterium]|nr:glycoside hydrolase family 127 protein [Victivallales bacterium]
MKQSLHDSVKFTGGFWLHLEEINRNRTIPMNYKQLVDTGRIKAMKLEWKEGEPDCPHHFWDSDVAKWMEAAAFSLKKTPDSTLEKQIDEIIDIIERGQTSEGYYNSYFLQIEPTRRWQDLRIKHELYCAGHLMEAAVAYMETTGRRKFLDIMCKYADYIDTVFGPEAEGKIPGYPGHEEIELALVKMYHATNNQKYLLLSKFFVDVRGTEPNYFELESQKYGYKPVWTELNYFQAHTPVRTQDEAVGHAVRAVYLYCGMADVALETDDEKLGEACKELWDNIVKKKMYITGAIGSCYHGETFSNAYDLPNEEAYAETCASIGLAFFAHRMFQLHKKGEYMDVLERAIYNGASSGISLDGTRFFYVNPLACYPDGTLANGQKHTPRPEWFTCSCCPPNIARLRASAGQYFYDYNDTTIWVNLYNDSVTDIKMQDHCITLTQTTDYPWDGKVNVNIQSARPVECGIAFRVPGWCREASIKLNGTDIDCKSSAKDGYVYIKRTWTSGDNVEITLPMPVELIHANPKVRHDCGRVALTRGPLVYCFEQQDNGADLNAVSLMPDTDFKLEYDSELLNGCVVISTEAMKIDQNSWGDELYSPKEPVTVPCKLKAVPYFCWGNRKFGEMQIWIRQ